MCHVQFELNCDKNDRKFTLMILYDKNTIYPLLGWGNLLKLGFQNKDKIITHAENKIKSRSIVNLLFKHGVIL